MMWKTISFLAALLPSFCSGQQNIAAFKPSNQSSTYSVYGPQLANDENERTCSIAGESDTSMQEKVFGWWQVDLLESYSVSHLLIKTSTNSYEAKFLANFIVLVTNVNLVDSSNSADICATYVDDDPPVDGWISLNCKSSGRFVTIKRGGGFRHDAISICEVSVTSENSSEAQCPPMQFRCLSGRCINAGKHCDGVSDCPDNSDEVGCAGNIASSTSTTRGPSSPTVTSTVPSTPTTSTFTKDLPFSTEIFRSYSADYSLFTIRRPSTSSSSSPSSSSSSSSSSSLPPPPPPPPPPRPSSSLPPPTSPPPRPSSSSSPSSTYAPLGYCGRGSFDCKDGTCIRMRLLCDGFFDCSNKADENNCTTGNSCSSDEFVCLNHQCIDKNLTCDGFPDCSDESDERPSQCGNSTKPPFPCANGYRACDDDSCIPSSNFCDRVISCSDKSDESTNTCGIPFNDCDVGDFICFDGECISGLDKCDGRPDCADKSDESVETCGDPPPKMPCLAWTEFTCSDGSCINNDLKCNGDEDCPNGEDEDSSHCAACTSKEFLCQLDNACIPSFKRCNGRADCADQSDEKECDKCSSPALHCEPLMSCFAPQLVCNYVFDCPDGSDEANCSNCPAGFSRCTNGPCIPDKYFCDGNPDCPYGEDEDLSMCTKLCTEKGFYCSHFGCISRTLLCNGVFDCPFEEDEKQESCQLVGVCGKNQYKCLDKKCIPTEWVCDGEADCQSGEDEDPIGCESCDASQFQCLSRKSKCILRDRRCDGSWDCEDGSDELGCVWMEQTVNREWRVLVLIGNIPHTMCPDRLNVECEAVICKYMTITSHPPINTTGVDVVGFASLNPDFKFTSIFGLVKAFQIRSSCNTNQSLKCDFSKKCGVTDSDLRLVSGYPAEPGMWPWHALLMVYPNKICGASLVGGYWYLTSASCVTTNGSKSLLNTRSVKLYTDSLRNDGSSGKLRNISKIIVHPDYDHRTGASDVALVRTQSEPGSPEIHEICLPDPFKYTNNETSKLKICYVSGFGLNRRGGFPSPVLLSARFDMLDQKQCMATIFNTSNIRVVVDYAENLCAGSYEPIYGFNICEYDFGGPLVCRDNDLKWTQIGIASKNIGSACKNSLFTRVTRYLGFIYDTMINNN